MKVAESQAEAGDIGARATRELLSASHEVTVLDSLLHRQDNITKRARGPAAPDVIRGDVRDAASAPDDARRRRGGRAPGRDRRRPGVREGSRPLSQARQRRRHPATVIADAEAAGRGAGSSSPRRARTKAAWRTRSWRSTRPPPLSPVSLYAEQKVAARDSTCCRARIRSRSSTCLRFATIYGVAERMRFDLTVNEFTRDLWDVPRRLEVYGERFPGTYVHVARRGARASRPCWPPPPEQRRRHGLQRRPTRTRTTASSTSSR